MTTSPQVSQIYVGNVTEGSGFFYVVTFNLRCFIILVKEILESRTGR
jgi:hypothetical protein